MKPYKCKGCQKVIAYISAQRFEVGGIVFDRSYRIPPFRCQACGHEQVVKRAVVKVDTDPLQRQPACATMAVT
jgi:DNA-directed RNA polymerase subunit RPC12/RpoP